MKTLKFLIKTSFFNKISYVSAATYTVLSVHADFKRRMTSTVNLHQAS